MSKAIISDLVIMWSVCQALTNKEAQNFFTRTSGGSAEICILQTIKQTDSGLYKLPPGSKKKSADTNSPFPSHDKSLCPCQYNDHS